MHKAEIALVSLSKRVLHFMQTQKNWKSDKKPQGYLQESNENCFSISPIWQKDAEDSVQNMQTNKACGPNSIPTSILKTLKKEF